MVGYMNKTTIRSSGKTGRKIYCSPRKKAGIPRPELRKKNVNWQPIGGRNTVISGPLCAVPGMRSMTVKET